jgi:ELWxxDGT repeat protein
MSGGELWKSDGTESGTFRVNSGSFPDNYTDVGGTLYFSTIGGTSGTPDFELWKSDGTEAGTELVDVISRNFDQSIIIQSGAKLFVVGSIRVSTQITSELWVADLTETPPLTGDYNGNGTVDTADYIVWRKTLGSNTDLRANGDNTGPSAGVIDQADYAVWRANFGKTIPSAASNADQSALTTAPHSDDVHRLDSSSQATSAATMPSELPATRSSRSALERHLSPEHSRISWELALLSLFNAGHTTTAVREYEFLAPEDHQSVIYQFDDYMLAVDGIFATNPQFSMAANW